MSLAAWAERWKIPQAAIDDLAGGLVHPGVIPACGSSESAIQSMVRLEAAKKGLYLWRNNVGAGKVEGGGFMRWGLANDSKAVNAIIKSGDLIGIRPLLISPDHVGKIVGQFVSRECKRAGWKYRGTPEEAAQARWAALVNSRGGDAAIVSTTGSL